MKKIILIILMLFCFLNTYKAEGKDVEVKYQYTKNSEFYRKRLKDKNITFEINDLEFNIKSELTDLDIVLIPVEVSKNDFLKDYFEESDDVYYLNAYDEENPTHTGIYIKYTDELITYIRANEDKAKEIDSSKNINLKLDEKTFYIIEDNLNNSPKTSDSIMLYVVLGLISISGIVITKQKLKKSHQ